MYKQILTAINQESAHTTFPFPIFFGQNSAHRCWIQVGQNRLNIEKQTNFNQRLLVQVFDYQLLVWPKEAKCKISANILLLYTSINPADLNQNIPQTLALTFKDATTEQIYEFINPPYTQTTPLPIRYFTNLQRALITKELLKRDINLTSNPIQWAEPTDPATIAQLAEINTRLDSLVFANKAIHQTKKQQKLLLERSPAYQQSQFFRLYTKFEFPRETEGAGWPTAQSIIDREMQDLSPQGLAHPTTVERHAKWELVFNHWHNLQYLRTAANMSPQETLHIAALIEQVTGQNPLETLNSTTQPTPSEPKQPEQQDAN